MTHKFAALYGRPLAPLLGVALGAPVEVRWCNDAAAAVAGEALAGAGAGYRTVLGVTLGTGLGAALVRDGGVVTRAGDTVVGDLWQHTLPDGRPADTTFAARTLLAAVEAGNGATFAADLAEFLAPVVEAAAVDVVVVGGGGAGSFDQIATALRAALPVPVERAHLGPWAALLGAAHLCW
jgi:glucokinase